MEIECTLHYSSVVLAYPQNCMTNHFKGCFKFLVTLLHHSLLLLLLLLHVRGSLLSPVISLPETFPHCRRCRRTLIYVGKFEPPNSDIAYRTTSTAV